MTQEKRNSKLSSLDLKKKKAASSSFIFIYLHICIYIFFYKIFIIFTYVYVCVCMWAGDRESKLRWNDPAVWGCSPPCLDSKDSHSELGIKI